MWPLQWYHQGPANKLCWLIYAEPLWLIGFTMRENRVSCNRNSEWCELFRIWLMNWKIHISSLNPHCVSMFTSNTHWEWEDDLAALAQHSTEALISRKIFILYQPLRHWYQWDSITTHTISFAHLFSVHSWCTYWRPFLSLLQCTTCFDSGEKTAS